ncbi:hypothetical protein K449DRAFT_206355 [Hypoxylon sp. EC38]|nr:hypothetical protein K449DRAFT_206355 [Hypoxylon sp. EC38]
MWPFCDTIKAMLLFHLLFSGLMGFQLPSRTRGGLTSGPRRTRCVTSEAEVDSSDWFNHPHQPTLERDIIEDALRVNFSICQVALRYTFHAPRPNLRCHVTLRHNRSFYRYHHVVWAIHLIVSFSPVSVIKGRCQKLRRIDSRGKEQSDENATTSRSSASIIWSYPSSTRGGHGA